MFSLALIFFFLGGGFLLGSLLSAPLFSFLGKGGALRENYRGEKIPTAGGLLFPLALLLLWVGAGLFFPASGVYSPSFTLFLLALTLVSLVSLVDDLLGLREPLGLKGHGLYFLTRKELSGGLLKVLGIGGMALGVTPRFSLGTGEILLNTFLLALSANALNLFDRRPGRALKVFGGGCLVLLALSGLSFFYFLSPLVGIALAYAPYDFRSRVMLGDTGANLLGFALGLGAVLVFPFGGRLLLLLLLISLHFYAEKYSLSALIERVAWLRYLDRLGCRS